MPYYKGEHNKLVKVCNQVLNLIYTHPRMLSQDSQLIIVFTLAVLSGAVVPHLKRGTVVVEPRHYRDLTDHWGLGGIYTFSIPLQWLFFHLYPVDRCPVALSSFSLFSIGDLELLSIPL